jgi:cytoskeleton protein RodZ
LKVDAAPVLALLPPPNGHRLEQVAEGLNMPFHDRPGRFVPSEWASVASPVLWIAGLLVVGTVLVYVLPPGWLPRVVSSRPALGAAASAPATAAASSPSLTSPAVSDTESLMPPAEPAASSGQSSGPAAAVLVGSANANVNAMAPAPAGVLQLRTTAQSWVEVVDASGQAILGRLVQPGEALSLDGAMPFKLRIGNATGTQVLFRGQPVPLAPYTRDNVARFELK